MVDQFEVDVLLETGDGLRSELKDATMRLEYHSKRIIRARRHNHLSALQVHEEAWQKAKRWLEVIVARMDRLKLRRKEQLQAIEAELKSLGR